MPNELKYSILGGHCDTIFYHSRKSKQPWH